MNGLAVRPINGLALCAGVGGLELGLKLALGDSYRCVCYVEREGFCAATLVARMEDEALDRAPIWDDLTTFDGRAWRGVVDLVSAGFPCQPFSAAGKRAGTNDPRWLWPEIARIIAEVAPAGVFLENVPGLVGHGLRVVWTDLRRMGYDVQAGLFSAAEVGAPHRRQRLFILAHTKQSRWRIAELPWKQGTQGDEPGRCSSGGRQLWPPGQTEAGWHGAEPAIRRASYGDASRLDERLCALGNGAVPLVAAYAFRTLSAQF